MVQVAHAQPAAFKERHHVLLDSLHEAQGKSLEVAKDYFTKLRLAVRQSEFPRDLRQLIPYLKRLESHPESTPAQLRRLYSQLGYDLDHFGGDQHEAMHCYLQAHAMGLRMKDVDDYWYVENPLGALYNMKGDHEQALYYYQFARRGIERLLQDAALSENALKQFREQYERLLNNMGYLYYWSGDYDHALAYLHTSLESARSSGNLFAQVVGARFMVEVYTNLKQFVEAERHLDRYLSLIPLLPESRQHVELQLYHQQGGLMYLEKGDCRRAINYLNKTFTASGHSGRIGAKNHNRLARAYLTCGYPDSTMMHIQKGLAFLQLELESLMARQQPVYEENAIAELLTSAAGYYRTTYAASNRVEYLDSALITATIALEVLEMLREKYLLEDSKTISIKETRSLIEQIVALIYLQNLQSNSNAGARAWPYIVQSKNVLLSDYDLERKAMATMPPNERDQLKAYHQRILELTSDQVHATDPQRRQDIADEIVSLRREIRFALDGAQVYTTTTAPSKSPFIEYLQAEDGLYVMENLRGTLRLSKLPLTENLDSLVMAIQAGMKSRDESAAFFGSLHQLYLLLLAPFEPLPRSFTVYPDGPLFLLPFPALIKQPEERRFLVYDYIINVGYTHAPPTLKRPANPPIMHAIAPAYPQIEGVYALERGELYHLPFAEREVEGLKNNWTGQFTAHTNLDKEVFFSLLAEEAHIHFAGHALVKSGAAWLALSADPTTWATFQEISRAASSARGVVLSACETGLGHYAFGDGVNSLAKSFLNAGVGSVVYSLWTVNDLTTAGLMEYYYRRLRSQKNAAKALAHAQRDYLYTHSGQRAHPYYWAAFVAADPGESGPFIPGWVWFILVGVFICLISLIYFKYSKSWQIGK